ncbi:MAG: GntR family transcriptional regulator [Streptosporangiales bacterium]
MGAKVGLVGEVASLVRERIYTHRYPTGAWLRQEQLSAELGISRTPVREALRVLELEGLVRVRPGEGARVVTGDVHTLLDAYQLRAVVDGLAARLAAERRGPARSLRAAIDRQVEALDPWEPRAYTRANVEFHEEITHMTGNEFVVAQLPILRMTAQVFAPVRVVEPSSAQRAIRQHLAIANAIESADGPTAERLAREHIEATIEELRAAASQPEQEGAC